MTTRTSASPADAQRAFYQAFEHADLSAMMAVWAEDEEVVCVHPGGPRLSGLAAVRESWRQIFSQGMQLKFRLVGEVVQPGRSISVHNLYEHVSIVGDPRPATAVLATNVYVNTNRGWRMLMHHASPLAGDVAPAELPPSILH